MRARLGDIATVSAGQSAPQGLANYTDFGIPFVKAGNLAALIQGKSENDIQKVSEGVAHKHKLKLFPKGTVVFAKSGMSCMKGYVHILSRDAYLVNHLAGIVPYEVESEYLKYYFEFHKPNKLVKDLAYPSIALSEIAELEIVILDQNRRQEIIKKLDKVTDIIAKRRRQIDKLDELVKARFAEMFGDQRINSKRFPEMTLGESCKFFFWDRFP